ncbi:hypothetical protein CL617_00615 [archaeon]|nr:hypothetical protein [archaeon]
MDIRNFTSDEIGEINNYVTTQIPQSILPQLFILSEEKVKKVKIFIAIYRIVSATKDFVEKQETKDKLRLFLEPYREIYLQLYTKLLYYEQSNIEYGKHKEENIMIQLLLNNNDKVNYLCNSFLVFAEKQELISTNTVTGIKLDKPEGEDIMEKLSKLVKG